MSTTTAAPLYRTPLARAAPRELGGQELIRADDPAARPLVTGFDAADGYEIPLPTLTRSRGRLPRARCTEDCGAAPLAVYAFLVIVGLAAAAWDSWAAMNNALAAEQLRKEAAERCHPLAASDRRTHAAAVRQAGSVEGSVCVIGAAELLQQALQMSVAYLNAGLASALLSMPIYGAGKGAAPFRPSIHLELPASVAEQSGANEARRCNVATEITSWRADNSGHVRGDLSVKAGRISIKSTGYYHVYSQVSIEDRSCRSATGLTLRRLRHSILRYNPLLNVVAGELIAVETWRCSGDSRGQQSGNGSSSFRKRSYLGATFLLLRGDEVYVVVSCIIDLTFNAAETYFGMHMV